MTTLDPLSLTIELTMLGLFTVLAVAWLRRKP